MRYQKLGNTGLFVSELCLGTMTFGTARWGSDTDASRAVFDAYVAAGGNFVDTADVYANTKAESVLGEALAEHASDIHIETFERTLSIRFRVDGVLRPVLNNITGNGKKQLALAGGDVELGGMGGMGGLDGELANDRVSLGGPQSILLPSPSEGYDAQLNAIKSLVAEDPGRVAQVVKEWINADE